MKKRFLRVICLSSLLISGVTFLASCNNDETNEKEDEKTGTVTLSFDSTKGSVTASKTSGKVGDLIRLTVTPNDGYEVDEVKANSTVLEGSNYAFNLVEGENKVEVTFKDASTPAPDIKTGTVVLEYDTTKGSVTSSLTSGNVGDSVTLEVEAYSGYEVSLVKANDTALEESLGVYTFTLVEGENKVEVEFSEVVNENDIAYFTGKVEFDGESNLSLKEDGTIVYWAGDGGNVSSFTYENKVYTMSYSNNGPWYGVQMFYQMPNRNSEDTYSASWKVTSDVAGKIRVNSTVYDIVEGENTIEFEIAGSNTTSISVQFGDTSSPTLQGSTFSFTAPVIEDKNSENVYHRVKFTSDGSVVKNIKIKDGSYVTAPSNPEKEGYIFQGWYDGDTQYESTLAITKDYNFVASLVDESTITTYTVSYYHEVYKKIVGEEKVAEGGYATGNIDYQFGYGKGKFYKDSEHTEEIEDITTFTPTSDTTVYVLPYLSPTYYQLGGSINSNGGVDISCTDKTDGGAGNAWVNQCNFTPVSTYCSDSSKTYEIKINYTLDSDVSINVQVYDGATKNTNTASITQGTNLETTLELPGYTKTGDDKLTFELGRATGTFTFTINSIVVSEKA